MAVATAIHHGGGLFSFRAVRGNAFSVGSGVADLALRSMVSWMRVYALAALSEPNFSGMRAGNRVGYLIS